MARRLWGSVKLNHNSPIPSTAGTENPPRFAISSQYPNRRPVPCWNAFSLPTIAPLTTSNSPQQNYHCHKITCSPHKAHLIFGQWHQAISIVMLPLGNRTNDPPRPRRLPS
ncbi:hypothetical protein O181_031020 [Austropuccinia psidii MF-1]|uniref:Uncharacterized protein n=1 Tax=Austropuccinia psidii MF-1 TaxID=1389203 RepID=A0A9Q3H6S9_9BASI|nr:hypothetical protein [Austropuccinia psidii MF-1]